MHRQVVALSFIGLIAGAPAFACALACVAPARLDIAIADQHQHQHSSDDSHHASPAATDTALQRIPHDCEHGPLPTLAEPSSQSRVPQTILTTVVGLNSPGLIEATLHSIVLQRPPGSRFLSAQLRI